MCFFFLKEKAGQWQRALHLLDLLKSTTTDVTAYDVVTYNALISACEKGQQWRKAAEFGGGGMYWATRTDFWRFGVFLSFKKVYDQFASLYFFMRNLLMDGTMGLFDKYILE